MRVLHVLSDLDQKSGGPLRAVLDLSAAAIHHGLNSEVLGFGPICIPDNPLPKQLIHSLPTSFGRKFAYCPELRDWCEANLRYYDGVVLHGMWSYPLWRVSKQCLRSGTPYACFPHGMLDIWSVRKQGFLKHLKKTIYWELIEKHILAGACEVFFTTERELENARRTFPFPQHGRILVPYGMATAPPVAASSPANAVRQPRTARVALFLGRVHPKKNVETLIRAWALARPPQEWRLVIAGPASAPYLRRLRALVNRLKLDRAVEFTGHVSGAAKRYLFRRAEWFLLPSYQENFGIAVLEAAAAGCAITISREVYLSDYFPSPSEVLSTELDDWVAFLKNRMPDREWRHTVANATQRTLAARFDFEKVTRAWAETLQGTFKPVSERASAEARSSVAGAAYGKGPGGFVA